MFGVKVSGSNSLNQLFDVGQISHLLSASVSSVKFPSNNISKALNIVLSIDKIP